MEANSNHQVHTQSRISSTSSVCCDTTYSSSPSEVQNTIVPCFTSEGDCPEKSAGFLLVSFSDSSFRV